ncbi:YybH family protein [Aurantiacibacter suaedae]|uniref:YybH family protein n=1 Tax=Aurantiacibacter suaedae TaxID=2545755 RepID=UPI0010F8D60A|nr:nuclear transport factor 2 family protein [Aurantiacibacter suaedae]
MRIAVLATLTATTLLAACSGGADPDDVIATIRATEQAQLDAIASDDLVGIARLYADDAVLVRPDGTRLLGGAAIADGYGDLIADPAFHIEVSPANGWAATSEDLATLASNVDITTTDPETGEPVTEQMISQTVWTRQSGGTWMIRSAINVPRTSGQAEPTAETSVEAAEAAAPRES